MLRNSEFLSLLEKGKFDYQDNKVYKSWSPDNVRTIILMGTKAVIEHYTKDGCFYFIEEVSLSKADKNEKSILNNISSLLSNNKFTTNYTAIEEIVFIVDDFYISSSLKNDLELKDLNHSAIISKFKKAELKDNILHNKTNFPKFYALTTLYTKLPSNTMRTLLLLKTYIRETQGKSRVYLYDMLVNYYKAEQVNYYSICNDLSFVTKYKLY